MNTIIFIVCMVAVTVYLAVATIEDYKTCEVTRWKHLIGFVPGLFYFVWNAGKFDWIDKGMVIGFAAIFVAAGLLGVYGLADGFVLANLTFIFGGISGGMGIGLTILVMVIACFSALMCYLRYLRPKVKMKFKNKELAFIPHLLAGYIVIGIIVLLYIGRI